MLILRGRARPLAAMGVLFLALGPAAIRTPAAAPDPDSGNTFSDAIAMQGNLALFPLKSSPISVAGNYTGWGSCDATLSDDPEVFVNPGLGLPGAVCGITTSGSYLTLGCSVSFISVNAFNMGGPDGSLSASGTLTVVGGVGVLMASGTENERKNNVNESQAASLDGALLALSVPGVFSNDCIDGYTDLTLAGLVFVTE